MCVPGLKCCSATFYLVNFGRPGTSTKLYQKNGVLRESKKDCYAKTTLRTNGVFCHYDGGLQTDITCTFIKINSKMLI